jgi:hypothetical protein
MDHTELFRALTALLQAGDLWLPTPRLTVRMQPLNKG